jgi:hypothetical protein
MEWKEICESFAFSVREYDSSLEQLVSFQIVQVQSRWHGYDVDWIPQIYKKEYLDHVAKYYATYWQTRAGTLRTAELLNQSRLTDHDRIAAVLILAAVHNHDKNQERSQWPYETYNIMGGIIRPLREHYPDIEWHWASRDSLPVCLGVYSTKFMVPHTEYELIHLFALEAILSLQTWQLVAYLPTKETGAWNEI